MDGFDFLVPVIAFILGVFLAYCILSLYLRAKFACWKQEHTDEIRKDSVNRSRSTLKGKIAEQMAPVLPGFRYEAADARFIGSPIDFVVFNGYTRVKDNREGEVGIVFLEVKKGKGTLSREQRMIRDAVENRRVTWETLILEDESR